MINFSDEGPARAAEREPSKAIQAAASVTAQQRLLAREAIRLSNMLSLAYTLSDHFEREEVILLHRDVREAVFFLLEVVQYLDNQPASEMRTS